MPDARVYFGLCLLLWSAIAAAAQEPVRIALLIGNQTYSREVGPLINPHTDVKIIGNALRKVGFKVTTIKDAGFKAMSRAVTRHVRRVRRAGQGAISFVYFTGHGVANPETGINYIVPVDAPRADYTLWENAIEQSTLINRLRDQAKNATHFVVFDACRDELQLSGPLNKSLGKRKGMVAINDTSGMLIAYATSPGATASDGRPGGNPYARALAEEVVRPGVEAVEMFRRVQLRVKAAIGQDPWLSFPALPAVYLGGKAKPQSPDVTAWEAIKNSNVIAQYRAYIERYPTSQFSETARFKIRVLENEQFNAAATAEWKRVETSSDGKVLEAYIGKYPSHPYANFARFRLAELRKQSTQRERQKAWDAVKGTTDTRSLRAFVSNHKGSLFAKLAEERIALLDQRSNNVESKLQRAAKAWQKIQDLKGVEPLQDFISTFGDTPFRSLAEARLEEVEQRQAKEAETKRQEAAARERERLAALEREKLRLRKEAEEAAKRQARAKAERQLAAIEAKRRRDEAEAAERQRKADLEREEQRRKSNAEAEARRQKLAEEERRAALVEAERRQREAEASEKQRAAALEREKVRLAALDAERKRLEAEEAEQRRKADEAEINLKNLTKSLQAELDRLGCDPGAVDGVWGNKSRKAIQLFNRSSGRKLDSLSPTLAALEALQKMSDRVCPKPAITSPSKPKVRRVQSRPKRSGSAKSSRNTQSCSAWFSCALVGGNTESNTLCGPKPANC